MRTTPKSQPSSAPAQPTTAAALSANAAAQNLTAFPINRYRCLFSAPSARTDASRQRRKATSLRNGTFSLPRASRGSHMQDVKNLSTLVLRIHSRLLRVRTEPLCFGLHSDSATVLSQTLVRLYPVPTLFGSRPLISPLQSALTEIAPLSVLE